RRCSVGGWRRTPEPLCPSGATASLHEPRTLCPSGATASLHEPRTQPGARRCQVERLRLAGAQINPVVGDIDGNADRILAAYADAVDRNAHLVVFPELSITGYPPEGLRVKPSFLAASQAMMQRLAREIRETAAVLGLVGPTAHGPV